MPCRVRHEQLLKCACILQRTTNTWRMPRSTTCTTRLLQLLLSLLLLLALAPPPRVAAAPASPRHTAAIKRHHHYDHHNSITFFVTSDTHLGALTANGTVPSLTRNLETAACMRATFEEPLSWPRELGGGLVRAPAGVVVTGDLVDAGGDPALCGAQWREVDAVWSGEGAVGLPVFAGFGKHDGGSSSRPLPGECNAVRRALRRRNLGGGAVGGAVGGGAAPAPSPASQQQQHPWASVRDVHVSRNDLHYAWTFVAGASGSARSDGGERARVRMIMLNLYPGDTCDGAARYPYVEPARAHASWMEPQGALQFLADDLRRYGGGGGGGGGGESGGASGAPPIIVAHHLGLDPDWGAAWWSAAQQDAYAAALAPYADNVAALLVGHTHVADSYSWRGLDVFNAPASQRDADDGAPLPCSFLVVELDAATGALRVALREGDGWGPLGTLRNISFLGGGGGVAVT